ncbi:MAG: addiction module antidote protein [Cyanobacteria bacterium J06634_6]
MSKTITTPYDVVDYLQTPEEMAAYLEASIEEAQGDTIFIAKALGDIARAKGMSQIAQDTGISCESLDEEFSGNIVPSLDTVLKVLQALGLKLNIQSAVLSSATSNP